MSYRWPNYARKMMDEVVAYFEESMEAETLEEFEEREFDRLCPFCEYDDIQKGTDCDNCPITKKFGVVCFRAFPAWHNYDGSWGLESSLPKLKTLLRAAIKELKPWATGGEGE